MNISKFKLSDGGYTGITVEAVESIAVGNLTILDHVTRKRPYPVPDDLREKIQNLKYFFLNLTGHWIEPYNKCFDIKDYTVIHPEAGTEPSKSYLLLQSILNRVVITGVSLKNAGFCISGTIETVEGKKMGLATPFVTEEDDVSFFIEAMDRITVIMDEIAGLLKSNKALGFNAKEVLSVTGVKTADLGDVSAEDMVNLVYEKFEAMGAIVLLNDTPQAITEGKKEGDTKVHKKTGSIDGKNVPDAIEHVEDEEKPVIIKEKAPIGKGSLASEKNFPDMNDELPRPKSGSTDTNIPDGGNLEHLEYSKNMGIPEEGAGIEGDEPVAPQGQW